MPINPTCANCHRPLPTDTGRGAWCPACGIGPATPARPKAPARAVLAAEVDDTPAKPAKPPKPARPKPPPDKPRNRYRVPLLFLQGFYIPFLGGLILFGGVYTVVALVGVWSAEPGERWSNWAVIEAITGILTGMMVVHLLVGASALFRKHDDKDQLEIDLPDAWQEGLLAMVDRVAADRSLDPPDAIRMHAATVAHVYQDREGQTVLVIGGMPVADLPQRALGGVVAHELAHVAHGDTAVGARARRWHDVMVRMDVFFLTKKWNQWNLLEWVFRGYHHLYARLWFAYQRACEYEADSQGGVSPRIWASTDACSTRCFPSPPSPGVHPLPPGKVGIEWAAGASRVRPRGRGEG